VLAKLLLIWNNMRVNNNDRIKIFGLIKLLIYLEISIQVLIKPK